MIPDRRHRPPGLYNVHIYIYIYIHSYKYISYSSCFWDIQDIHLMRMHTSIHVNLYINNLYLTVPWTNWRTALCWISEPIDLESASYSAPIDSWASDHRDVALINVYKKYQCAWNRVMELCCSTKQHIDTWLMENLHFQLCFTMIQIGYTYSSYKARKAPLPPFG